MKRCWRARTRLWRRRARRLEPWLAGALAVLFTLGLCRLMPHHEPWRDEIQAWLLARDTSLPWQLFHAARYEGHPILWYLVLWPFAHLSWNPVWMQVVHAMLAGCAAWLVLRCSPFPWPVRVLIPLGYFFAYEWGVLARNYAIAVLLLWIVCALHPHRWRWFLAEALALALLCHTNIFGLIMALALLPFLVVEFAVAWAGRSRRARVCPARTILGLALVAASAVASIIQMNPPADTAFAVGWDWHWNETKARRVAANVVRAALPVPPSERGYWNQVLALRDAADPAAPWWRRRVERTQTIRWAFLALVGASLLWLKRPWLLVPLWTGQLGMLVFFYVKIGGGIRHHGFLYLWPLALLWMSAYYRPWRLPWRWADLPFRGWDMLRLWLPLPLLLVHVYSARVAFAMDREHVFSHGETVAHWIRDHVRNIDDVLFVGDFAPACSSVTGLAQLEAMYYLNRNEWGSYEIWNGTRHGRAQVQNALALQREHQKPLILLVTQRVEGMDQMPADTQQALQVSGSVVSENYRVYVWPWEGDDGLVNRSPVSH